MTTDPTAPNGAVPIGPDTSRTDHHTSDSPEELAIEVDPGPCARCEQPHAAHTPRVRFCPGSSHETYLIPAEIADDGAAGGSAPTPSAQTATDDLADWLASVQQTVSAALWSLAKGESAEAIQADTLTDLYAALTELGGTSPAPGSSTATERPISLDQVLVETGHRRDEIDAGRESALADIVAGGLADDEAITSLLIYITARATTLLRDRRDGLHTGTIAGLQEIASLTDEALATAGAGLGAIVGISPSRAALAEALPNTVIRDREGDHWTLDSASLWHCPNAPLAMTIDELNEQFGPLTVIALPGGLVAQPDPWVGHPLWQMYGGADAPRCAACRRPYAQIEARAGMTTCEHCPPPAKPTAPADFPGGAE